MHRLGVLVGCLLLLSPHAAANHVESLLPPAWAGGSYDETNQTINLTWLPPGNDTTTPYTYHVYRNAVLVAETTQLWHVVEINGPFNAFQVTAWHDGNESMPSPPLIMEQDPNLDVWRLFEWRDPVGMGPCGLVGTYIDPDDFPHVFVTINPECLGFPGNMLQLGNPLRVLGW